MTENHPDPQLLERFMRDEVDEEARHHIVRHLLAGCAQCVQVTRRLWLLGEASPGGSPELAGADLHPASYRDVFRRLAGLGLRSERREAREQAELLALKSRLLAERGRLEEAERLLDRALVLVRGLGERHLQGRIMVQKGTIQGWHEGGEAARQGIGFLRQALVLLEPRREPLLVAFALHRLALLLADAGGGEEALEVLRQARPLYERHGDGPNLVRLRHLEGKIEAALGASQAAEAAFIEARRGFLAEGLGVEAAAVLLDLAILYRRAGRAAEIRRLAEDLFPILRARDIRQGVAAALLFFRDLVETGHATPEVLFAVSRYLDGPPRARRPALR